MGRVPIFLDRRGRYGYLLSYIPFQDKKEYVLFI
jgi:hypothetical protein